MPDDPQRPLSGQQSDPRPAAGAPAWWAALGRPDLPLDGDPEAAPARTSTPPRLAPPAHGQPVTPRRPQATRWRSWALYVATLAVAALITCIATGLLSVSAFLTALLLFGVPLSVAATTATVVARRSR